MQFFLRERSKVGEISIPEHILLRFVFVLSPKYKVTEKFEITVSEHRTCSIV